jgi:hypothetical protein
LQARLPAQQTESLRRGLAAAVMCSGAITEQIGAEGQGPLLDLIDRKIEPERLGVERFVLVAAHGKEIGLCGLV